MKKTVIFDLDGTLALIDARRQLSTLPNGKINWDVFFDADNIKLDLPNNPVIVAFKAMQKAGHRMVIFSGRSDATDKATFTWLDKFGIEPDMIKMRRAGSYIPDDKLKEAWLQDLLDDGEDVFCTFDDRDKVVEMWRRNGITCFQVAPGNF
jgi:FMN phosphatase YigB (HAD superfamily)